MYEVFGLTGQFNAVQSKLESLLKKKGKSLVGIESMDMVTMGRDVFHMIVVLKMKDVLASELKSATLFGNMLDKPSAGARDEKEVDTPEENKGGLAEDVMLSLGASIKPRKRTRLGE